MKKKQDFTDDFDIVSKPQFNSKGKFRLSDVIVPKGRFYCKNNQGNWNEKAQCQNQCNHCAECEGLRYF